jgi:ribosomal protein S18 acetylase RimI-like enzyme
VITYADAPEAVTPADLEGFFVGWPRPPAPERRLDLLRGSDFVSLAFDGSSLVGFVTAVSDGVLAAYIPFLEVLPSHQGQGIGTALVRRILDRLDDLYMVDVVCDAPLESFYERLGFLRLDRGLGLRRRDRIR